MLQSLGWLIGQVLMQVLMLVLIGGAVVLGLAALWSIIQTGWSGIRWQRLGHQARASMLHQALEAALRQYSVDPIGLIPFDFAHHHSLSKMVVAANVWLRTHEYPGAFNAKNIVTVYADYKVTQSRFANVMQRRISETLAGQLAQ